MVIEDGNIIQDNLERNHLTEQWLREQLRKNNISSHTEVFAAMLDTQGRLYFSIKNDAFERTASLIVLILHRGTGNPAQK